MFQNTYEALQYIHNSGEAQRFLASCGSATNDAMCNMIEDSMIRAEYALAGVDTSNVRNPMKLADVGVKTADDAGMFNVPETVNFDPTLRVKEYADIDILADPMVMQTSNIPVGKLQDQFRIDDFAGEYKAAKGDATDLPVISLASDVYNINVQMGHGAITWNQQEMDQAAVSGRPLDMLRVMGINRKYLEYVYDLVVYGNDKIKGLMNGGIDIFDVADTVVNPNSAVGAAKKWWVNKTFGEIVKDLTIPRQTIGKATKSRWGGASAGIQTGVAGNSAGFTCLVSESGFYTLINTFREVATDTYQSVWEYLNTPNGKMATGITHYKVVHDFDSSFNGKTEAGFMLLPQDTAAYSFEKPLGLTSKPVQFTDLIMKVPYYDYFAGLKLIRDKACVGYKGIAEVA